jgi:hypothetical protein
MVFVMADTVTFHPTVFLIGGFRKAKMAPPPKKKNIGGKTE